MSTNARIERLAELRGGDKAQIAQEQVERSRQVSTTTALYRTTADRITELNRLRSLKSL